MYPFSMAKQGTFDVLAGNFKHFVDQPFEKIKKHYDELLYSANFIVKAKKKIRVRLEVEKHKKEDKIGFGFLRSFEHDIKVQDLAHQLGVGVLHRGKKTIMSKAEIEMSIALDPSLKKDLIIVRLIDGIVATSKEVTNRYMSLYTERKRLKNLKNPAEQGYKIILNSCYGKTSESTGKWFSSAVASSTTALARTTLIKTIAFAQSIGVETIYSDTDSLYVKSTDQQLKKIQVYASSLNDLPEQYKTKYLEDENENILAMWVIKRKRYVKILEKNGKVEIKITGPTSYQQTKWRDIFKIVEEAQRRLNGKSP
jgi:hypothetical protein